MEIAIHLSLIAAVVISTVALVVWDWGYPPKRSLKEVLIALLPLVVVGGVCGLLMSATGAPLVEWVIPALAVLTVGMLCGSERVFHRTRWAMFLVTIILCVNFTSLVHGDFTAAPGYSRGVSKARQALAMNAARKALEKSYPADTVLPEGSVATLLGEPDTGIVEVDTIERCWFTPLTRLYLVKRGQAMLWCPGGSLEAASKQLELRAIN